MEEMKKFISFLLTIIMVFSMAVSVFATSGTNDDTGKITINNAVEGETYKVYQLLVLESFDTVKKAYAYKAVPAWENWLRSQTTYLSFDGQGGYVSWKKDADPAAFAKLALAEAKELEKTDPENPEESAKITPISRTATGNTVVFDNLNLGYYLVDTTLGTLCFLDTTAKEVTIAEKNKEPTVDKEVKEDSTGEFGSTNTAQIGDTVEFRTTIHTKKGAQSYVLHDKMTEGLTLNPDSISIEGLEKGTDYKVQFDRPHQKKDGTTDYTCTFEIVFAQAYLDTITEDTDLVVTYFATLNEKAVISTDANLNDTRLEYGEASTTEWKQTETKTFKFGLVKLDEEKKLLTGAEFKLYDAKTGGKEIILVKETDGVYRVATEAETKAEGFTPATIEAGYVEIKGLDADTYYLEETKAPDGFNKLKERKEVKMEGGNNTITMDGNVYKNGVQIVNKKGTELPSTGGMGTTVLYIAGALLILAAAAVLLLKKYFHKEA